MTSLRDRRLDADSEALGRSGVSIIVVTYRSAAYIADCVAAIRWAAPTVPAELLIVDNASGDDSVAAAREAAPDALVIENERNGGFADGCHLAAARARGRWLMFVNPDAVPAPGSIDGLLACARRNPEAGIIGGKCMRPDGTADPRSWWGRPTLWSVFCFATLLTSIFPGSRLFDPESPVQWSGYPAEERRVPIVTGGFMLIDAELWRETGGFDRSIFMYGEDADLCLRAAALGRHPMVTARAPFTHPTGASSTSLGKLLLLFTGKVTVLRHHLPPGRRRLGIRLLTAGVLVRAKVGVLVSARPGRKRRSTTSSADWQGLWAKRAEWTRGWDPPP
jgi:N-acetylglucosaminyl-diphospho-decaprenol L-rhamnosyltransferase